MNNFVSVFEELSKLYEADELDQEVAVEDAEAAEEAPVEETAADEPKQLVLECTKCGAVFVKAEEDVVIDEATDLANVEEECSACEEAAGYKVLGELLPYASEESVEESIEDPEGKPEADLPAEGDQDKDTPDEDKQPDPEVTEALLESALTEGKLLDNVKKVATRVGADAATIVRCFTELGEMIANVGNKGEYKTTKLNDFMEYVENKAAFKALMNGNEAVMNGTTKEDLEELAQDIEEYKKAKAGKKDEGEDLEELLDANVNLSLDGGEGNDVDVL
jgi:DNA-binding transcriptional regulator YhcF (GntR family)